MLRDYDKLMGPKQERQAFLEPYKQFKLFRDANNGLSLEEFADAREVVADLSAEYEACEHADYVSAVACACAAHARATLACVTGGGPGDAK